jgi:hypothetical protein
MLIIVPYDVSVCTGYKITNSSLGPLVSAYRLLAEDSTLLQLTFFVGAWCCSWPQLTLIVDSAQTRA